MPASDSHTLTSLPATVGCRQYAGLWAEILELTGTLNHAQARVAELGLLVDAIARERDEALAELATAHRIIAGYREDMLRALPLPGVEMGG